MTDNVRGWASAGLLSLLCIADDRQCERVGQRRTTALLCIADDNVRGWTSAGLLSLLCIVDDKQYQRVGQRRTTVHFVYSR